jgi:hypothetical protein
LLRKSIGPNSSNCCFNSNKLIGGVFVAAVAVAVVVVVGVAVAVAVVVVVVVERTNTVRPYGFDSENKSYYNPSDNCGGKLDKKQREPCPETPEHRDSHR